MFKLGIYKQEHLTPDNLSGFLNSRKFIALDLYNSLDDLSKTERDAIQERMLGRFSVQSGVLKYTHARRFEDFDDLSVSTITANYLGAQRIRVHDIGASDGRTSCTLYERLHQHFGERLDFLASDYAPYLYVLKRADSVRRIIVDDRDNVLQIITPPFVFIVVRSESKILYPLNHLIRALATIFYARSLLREHKIGSPGIERTRIELLCQECRVLLSERDNFHFERYDVLAGPRPGFDIIRAMNILNHGYFSEVMLARGVENIVHSLNQGGLLITGSNTARGTTVDGGIYRKNGNRMLRLETSGSGSPVDQLITNIGNHAVT